MPSQRAVEGADRTCDRLRLRLAPGAGVIRVLPDYYDEVPKPCMCGWGRTSLAVRSDGTVLPCLTAAVIETLGFESIRDRPLVEIWHDSSAFNAFPGTTGCRSPPQLRAALRGSRRLPMPGVPADGRHRADRSRPLAGSRARCDRRGTGGARSEHALGCEKAWYRRFERRTVVAAGCRDSQIGDQTERRGSERLCRNTHTWVRARRVRISPKRSSPHRTLGRGELGKLWYGRFDTLSRNTCRDHHNSSRWPD